jgi:hypothetical protein
MSTISVFQYHFVLIDDFHFSQCVSANLKLIQGVGRHAEISSSHKTF